MDTQHSTYTETQLRDAAIVMKPDRLGAMHQNRISFARSLIRKMAKQDWQVTKHEWQLCPNGFGHVIYALSTPSSVYHLVIFSNKIDDQERNDRVIAEKWDITFALILGEVDNALLEQLEANVPLQEAGRNPNRVLVLARANKSTRIFDHIISTLASGQQPEPKMLAEVGYILRTTAVYGNGKFGIADFKLLEDNLDFNQSFSAQMCAVYILRQFSLDWVHYIARNKGGGEAIELHKGLQRYLGVGNATGLGMAPYLINHPCIVDQWMTSRERSIADVLAMPYDSHLAQPLSVLLKKAKQHLQQVFTVDEHQGRLNLQAMTDIEQLIELLPKLASSQPNWNGVLKLAEELSLEAQEILTSCLLELYPTLVDKYENQMNASETLTTPIGKSVKDLVGLLKEKYQWAVEADYSLPENNHWFWYRSQDKEEPRLGVRGKDTGEEHELPLDIGKQTNQLFHALSNYSQEKSVTEFLLQYPRYRAITRRVWTLGNRKMGDIQVNVLRQDALPMHLLRCKLAMLGATKFDPRSDRWVRVTFFQGAPLLKEITDPNYSDTWIFPVMPCEQKIVQNNSPKINGRSAS